MSTNVNSKSQNYNATLEKIIILHCKRIFAEKADMETIFISASNIYENTLKDFVRINNPNISVERKTFSQLIDYVKDYNGFSQKFISFFYKVRWRGNKQRHLYLDDIDDIDLTILRFEVFSYLKWFFREHLNQPPIALLDDWYQKVIAPDNMSVEITRLNKVISDYESRTNNLQKTKIINSNMSKDDQVEKLTITIRHYKKNLKEYQKREEELTKEILKLRKASR